MGSVIKRGATYYIRYDEPRGSDGRRRQRMISCRGMNKKQAEARLREIETQLHNGSYIEPARTSFGEYLDEWMEKDARHRLGQATHGNYEIYIGSYIKPTLGSIRLDRLKPVDLQNAYNELATSGGRAGKGLSAKTVRNVHGIIHTALAAAVRSGILARNPADQVTLPKRTRPEIKVASTQDLAKLIEASRSSKYHIPILIALSTGMRRGEVLGLKWEDFDPVRKTLTVVRALSQLGATRVVAKNTKSGKPRVVALPEFLVSELEKHRQEQSESQAACSVAGQGWICAESDGTHMTPSSFSKEFRRLAARAGVDITLHGLRHTQATLLIESGTPVKVVQERLGHSSPSITQEIYAHVLPHMQDAAAKVTDDILNEAAGRE